MTKNTLRALLFATSATVFSVPAYAQDEAQPEDAGGIQEIIVTAQKRAENVQDVPIAVAAFGGEALREKGVDNVAQLANLTPSVQLSQSSQFLSSPSVLSGFIRGIGQDDFAANFEPGVGTYIDGVYLARSAGSNVDLMDVERVEILKGPQGTLFGRNTIGGAISVVTREPKAEPGFSGQITGGSFGRFEIGGVADVPLGDGLRSSLAASGKLRDGFQKRIPFPGLSNFAQDPANALPQLRYRANDRTGGNDELSFRGKLVWDSVPGLKVTLAADYTTADGDGGATNLIDTSDAGALPGGLSFFGVYNTCINLPAAIIAVTPLAGICGPRQSNGNPAGLPALAGVNADANPANNRLTINNQFVTGDFDTTYGTGVNYSRLRNYGFMGNVAFDLGPDVTLRSITAYRNLSAGFGADVPGTPVADFDASILVTSKQFSQELQLTGQALDGKLDFLLGGYFFDEKAGEDENVMFAGGLFQIVGNYRFHTKSYAAFAHLNYRVNDLIGITLGGRYTSEKKTLNGSQRDLNRFLDKAGVPPFLFPNPADTTQFYAVGTQRLDFDDFSPRIGLELHPTDDVMVYGSYAKGFKSGGWTTRIAFPDAVDPSLPADKQAPFFNPEKADTYEIGLKSQFADRMVQINAAAFLTDYKGIQIQIQRGASPSYENAGNARIQGFEVETVFAPSRAFRLNASLGYIDAKYKRVDDPSGVITLASSLPRIPEWTFSVSPEFNLYLANDSRLTLRGDYTHKSNVFNDVENTPEIASGETDVVNVSLTYAFADDKYSLSVGANNVFDERFYVNGVDQRAGAGYLTGSPNRPREYYATLRVKM